MLVADSENEVRADSEDMESGMEAKVLRVKVAKIQGIINDLGEGFVIEVGKWPFAVCMNGVGSNSVMCSVCESWLH